MCVDTVSLVNNTSLPNQLLGRKFQIWSERSNGSEKEQGANTL